MKRTTFWRTATALLLVLLLLPLWQTAAASGVDYDAYVQNDRVEGGGRDDVVQADDPVQTTELPMVEFKEKPGDVEIWDGTIATSYAGGTGTQDDPYLIENGAQLAYL
ncbi:MAG: hypothetical protein Q4B99_03745, partial [Clostridia bacterium]|nr:hypothetical protein [Clostridia bacterium]